MKSVRIPIGILTAALILWPTTVQADSAATDVSVSPAITEWIVDPGKTQQKDLWVTNTTTEPLPIESITAPFAIEDIVDGEHAKLYDTSQWIQVEDPDFILRPQQSRQVRVVLSVPRNASPGGHYATIYFHQLQSDASQNVAARIGSLVFIIVKGTVTKKLQAAGLNVTHVNNDITIKATIRNTGNTHAMPEGYFAVLDWTGREMERIPLPQGMTLPYTTRTYDVQWHAPGLGAYRIKPMLYFDNNQLTLQPTIVWLFPWVQVVGGLCAALILWFGVYTRRIRWIRAIKALTASNAK